jgi:hypothetical protein
MYISDTGKIYLINTSMNIIFTGAKTLEKRCFNTILDGELIKHDKYNNFINLYMAFDIYYLNKHDIRALQFVKRREEDKIDSRYQLLSEFLRNINPVSVTNAPVVDKDKSIEETHHPDDLMSPIRIQVKEFYPNNRENIFQGCAQILTKQKNGLFEYNTDGLIFTHKYYGVGSNKEGSAGDKRKITWKYSFKWKPPYFNTIDFLVTTVKERNNNDVIKSIFVGGMDLQKSAPTNQYKVIELRCGFNEKKNGFVNPCQFIIEDKSIDVSYGIISLYFCINSK